MENPIKSITPDEPSIVIGVRKTKLQKALPPFWFMAELLLPHLSSSTTTTPIYWIEAVDRVSAVKRLGVDLYKFTEGRPLRVGDIGAHYPTHVETGLTAENWVQEYGRTAFFMYENGCVERYDPVRVGAISLSLGGVNIPIVTFSSNDGVKVKEKEITDSSYAFTSVVRKCDINRMISGSTLSFCSSKGKGGLTIKGEVK